MFMRFHTYVMVMLRYVYAMFMFCFEYVYALLMLCSCCAQLVFTVFLDIVWHAFGIVRSCYGSASGMLIHVETPSEPSAARRVRQYDDGKYVQWLLQCSSYADDMFMPCLCYVHAMRVQILCNTHATLMPCVRSLGLNTFADGFQVYYLKRASRSDARTGSQK